jgi:hypothetical protein
MGILKRILLPFLVFIPAWGQDNGIHVAPPKVYDARALQLMMDELADSLKKTSFIDPKALANALGNVQGYSATDLSQQFAANGAVGPNAAGVFAGTAGSAATAPPATGSTTPPVTITISPTVNQGTAAPAAGGASGAGPQAPALPTLQTGPTYNPNFGPSGGDLLTDETNLTYQLFNLRMMLERALSDRLYHRQARRQAVLGFDIDVVPSKQARDAAAIVDVTVRLNCNSLPDCNPKEHMSVVALMPEEGSHNAATLSQKATGFGGALASAVFSVGYSVQKRNTVFYVYRDMDTLSFQVSPDKEDPNTLHFGWQFRPVLGRHTVAAGKRHLLVVLALPGPDEPETDAKKPQPTPSLTVNVKTSWHFYDGKLQATSDGYFHWRPLHPLPGEEMVDPAYNVDVPSTSISQFDLQPHITSVKWAPTDSANGVAILTGKNFFPGTTVRFGNKTYAHTADGLVIKSDQELEVAVPSTAAALGGVLSGRYGTAQPIASEDAPPHGFTIANLSASAIGNSLYYVDVTLQTREDGTSRPAFASVLEKLNTPVVLLNGAPVNIRPSLTSDAKPERAHVVFTAPAEAFSAATVVTVTFPFAGPHWVESIPYYKTTLNVARLAGQKNSTLVISANNPGAGLCDGWTLELDPDNTFAVGGKNLTCLEKSSDTLAFNIDSDTLSKYKRFVLTKDTFAPFQAEIPKSDAPSPSPTVDKPASVKQNDLGTVTFTGKYLDKVTKVLLDKTELKIVTQAKDKIVISLPKEVTEKARENVQLQLLSDGNDPVLATVTVVGVPEPKGK